MIETKICINCKKDKSLDNFKKYSNVCKECANRHAIAYNKRKKADKEFFHEFRIV